MNILLIEPYFTGAHKRWCEELCQYSAHEIDICSLPGRHWKWRMHGAAVQLSEKLNDLGKRYDLLLVSDYLDVATFKSLYFDQNVPIAIYFHENQISYPWSKRDDDLRLVRDNHYGWVNFTSALISDWCFFNSRYHMNSFLGSLPKFLSQFPDGNFSRSIESIEKKSEVLYLGLDLKNSNPIGKLNEEPVILWNHRWEYDKNPEEFFNALESINDLDWKVMVLGESFGEYPAVFDQARDKFRDRIVQWGFVESKEEYQQLLSTCDIVISTAIQEFFGGSVIEAIHFGAYPLLPNRLSYPEHVEGNHLYADYDQLKQKLRNVILSHDYENDVEAAVSRYDWSVQIPIYNLAFTKLLNQLA